MFDNIRSVGIAAMLLALTRTMQDEECVKKMLNDQGFRYVVTEVGGNSDSQRRNECHVRISDEDN